MRKDCLNSKLKLTNAGEKIDQYKFWIHEKIFLIHVKNFDPRINIFDLGNPRKSCNPRKMLTCVKSVLTHVTYAIHVKTQPTQATDPSNILYNAIHVM